MNDKPLTNADAITVLRELTLDQIEQRLTEIEGERATLRRPL